MESFVGASSFVFFLQACAFLAVTMIMIFEDFAAKAWQIAFATMMTCVSAAMWIWGIAVTS